MIFWALCLSLLCCIISMKGVASQGKELHIPKDPLKCLNRPKHWHWAPKHGGRQHHYFYSSDVPEFKNLKYDWLSARNLCRSYCMDAVGIETEAENNMIFDFVKNHDIYEHAGPTWNDDYRCGPRSPLKDGSTCQCDSISDYSCCGKDGFCISKDDPVCHCPECIDYSRKVEYLWTAGRLCDFDGCENRPDLKPLDVKGWFFSNNQKAIPDTNRVNWSYQPWSQTGHSKKPQPDNAEFGINGTPESCLGVLNNVYNDGIKWHDIACYHEKPVLCEDSDELLQYMHRLYPQYNLY